MIAKENAPICSNRFGARKQDNFGKHPVPIVTHYPKHRKQTQRRYKLVWTPVNVALFILLIAAMTFMVVRAIAVDPLEQSDLISMANSVFRV